MKFRKILAILLCLSLFLPGLPTASAGEEELTDTIEDQIRAFADSIDQSDAVDDAARALAVHGMTKGGKKLSVGKSHALTATLFNSEMLQAALIEGCTATIQYMQQVDRKESVYLYGNCSWYGADSSQFQLFNYPSASYEYENRDMRLAGGAVYIGARNDYDSALDWMAAGTYAYVKITYDRTTTEGVVYQVTCSMNDRFDFSTSASSFFKGLISGIGALLFKEFNWEATATFTLTVPNSCTHSSGQYRWTYNPEDLSFTTDNSDGNTANAVALHSFIDISGQTKHYYELDNTVRLIHDKPWVLEYDVRNPGRFVLAPFKSVSTVYPCLRNGTKAYLAVLERDRCMLSDEQREEYGMESNGQYVDHYYGSFLSAYFSYSNTATYTFRLENEVNTDGSNMIYLTVFNTGTGDILLEHVAMDRYYCLESWSGKKSWESGEADWLNGDGWISGKDLYINYIGNQTYSFSADYFDLRIWENGEDGESVSYYEKASITAPTCTEQGYTTYTCSACGHSYNADYTDALGHSFGEWERTKEPTCTENGEEQRDCANCDHYETREIAASGHDYKSVVTEPSCTEQGYTTYTCPDCGDSYVGDYTDPVEHSYEDGYCTWCGENENYVKWLVATTSLNGTIDLNIYVVLSEDILNDPSAFVRFEHSGVTVEVPVSEGIPSKKGEYDCFRYSCEIYAKQVADTVTVQVMNENGTIGDPLEYSVMQYCVNQIKKAQDEKQVAVCKAMLNYAAAAQTYFGYNTENLANASLSEADKVLPEVDASDYKFTVEGSEPGIKPRSATLMLEAEVSIRVYFTLEEGYDISDFTFTIDGEEVEVQQNNKGYYIESDGIPAKELDEMHQFSVGGLTVNYGALSYVHSKVTSEKTELNERNLAKALYAYYVAAEALLG